MTFACKICRWYSQLTGRGIVGEDGATHNGIFDIAYLRSLPNMAVDGAG